MDNAEETKVEPKLDDDKRRMYFRNRYYERRNVMLDLHFYLDKEKDKAMIDFLNSRGKRGRSIIIKEAVAYYMQGNDNSKVEEQVQEAEAVKEGEEK